MNTEKLKKLITLHEGTRNHMYQCSAGFNTIGIGHNLDANPISDAAVNQIFNDDVNIVLKEVGKFAYWNKLNEARQAVIIDMCFNMGYSRLSAFKKMHSAIEAGNFKEAGVQMMDSNWSKQVGSRAARLRKMMETGEYETI